MGQLFQGLLDGIGWVLARIYDFVPNYGLAIILLTLIIRVLLLPLAIKQIRSMQAMQVIQPKVKELQRKYKGKDPQTRQKLNQEVMKLYQAHGASPLSGCLPIIAQFPVLIALFAVLNFPKGLTHIPHDSLHRAFPTAQDSRLYVDIVEQRTKLFGMNLVCSPREAGQTVKLPPQTLKDFYDLNKGPKALDCGKGTPARIPYYVLLVLMVGTTYFQQRQMQRASPAGSQQQQQQMLARIMPLFFGFIGLGFPTGLILYWTTTNAVQIVQQHFMLSRQRLVAPAPVADDRSSEDGGAPRRSLWGRMLELGAGGATKQPGGSSKPQGDGGARRTGGSAGTRGSRSAGASGGGKRAGGSSRTPSSGSGASRGGRSQGSGANPRGGDSTSGTGGSSSGKGTQSGGGRNGGDRKKRRKR